MGGKYCFVYGSEADIKTDYFIYEVNEKEYVKSIPKIMRLIF